MDSIQCIADTLAERLHRSVAIDDSEFRLIAHSRHFGDEDPSRIASLIGRSVTPERRKWSADHGTLTSLTPVFTPPFPEPGEKPRLVVPCRSGRELLALIWIIDDGTLVEADVAQAVEAAESVASVLSRQQFAADAERREREQMLLALLADSQAERSEAATELTGVGLFSDAVNSVAFVVDGDDLFSQRDAETGELFRRVERVLSGQRRGALLIGVAEGQLIAVLGFSAPLMADLQQQLALDLHRGLAAASRKTASIVVGVGAPRARLDHAVHSYKEARRAVRLARVNGTATSLWGAASVDSLLAALIAPGTEESAVPASIRDITSSQTEDIIDVVEQFLAFGGNVARTAESMHLHRTTVYYRIARFTESTGFDLSDGDTRLLVHLWLRARRFLGAAPA
jgi:DNA-binding PucR family transcriptional regulator